MRWRQACILNDLRVCVCVYVARSGTRFVPLFEVSSFNIDILMGLGLAHAMFCCLFRVHG
jgi:hypothetical protein